jgi:hypothetical protein
VLRVDFGPSALGTPRREFLQPRKVVVKLFLAVDPSEAERLIEGSCVSNGDFSRVFLANAQPDAVGLAMIGGKPFAKLRGSSKAKNFEFLQIEPAFQEVEGVRVLRRPSFFRRRPVPGFPGGEKSREELAP